MQKHRMIHWNKILLELLGIFLFIAFMFPIILVFINAAKATNFEITSNPLALSGSLEQLWTNIKAVWINDNVNYSRAFLNSIITTVGSLFFIVMTSSLAGWALVRTKTKTSQILFYVFLIAMIIPFQVVMLPLVAWFRSMSDLTSLPFLRSQFGMIFAYIGFGAPLSIFLYHGFVKSIPVELEEAASIDGCNRFQTFIYIILPILKPITVTVLILNGIWIWNDFLLPLLILGKKDIMIMTVPLATDNFIGSFLIEWHLLLSSAIIAMIPVFILYLFAQRYIIKGMVAGSVK